MKGKDNLFFIVIHSIGFNGYTTETPIAMGKNKKKLIQVAIDHQNKRLKNEHAWWINEKTKEGLPIGYRFSSPIAENEVAQNNNLKKLLINE